MKKFKLIHVLGVAMIGLASFSSCTDACKDVDCGPGTCQDGDCTCPDGYSGTDCGTEDRAQFIGTYLASGSITCPVSGNSTFSDETMTISNSAVAVTKVSVDFAGAILLTLNVDGNNVTVEPVTTNGLSYTGTGSISGTALSLTLNELELPNVETCVYAITAVKQ